jgi:hypothetical protein
VHDFWQFLSNNFFWIMIGFGLFGGGAFEGGSRILDGHRKNALLTAQLKQVTKENKRMEKLLLKSMDPREVQKVIESDDEHPMDTVARKLDDRSDMINLLHQVQAADRAMPQLPHEIREELDEILLRHRHKRGDRV